jgi:hypothetical protein
MDGKDGTGMRRTTTSSLLVLLIVSLSAPSASAATLNGTVKLGGIVLDQSGDRSTVQETYNVFDGFSVNQVYLNGTSNASDHFMLDLREINLDSRKGSIVYRRPGVFKLTARYDQHRQLFVPDSDVNSQRKDWKVGAQFSPADWLSVTADFDYLTRDGTRASFPPGTLGVLGTEYDNVLQVGRVSVQADRDRIGGGFAYSISDFSDELNSDADRRGHVVSARLHAPCFVYDRWTHLLRGAYGISKLSNDDIDNEFLSFRYTGIIAPWRPLQFKYTFDASRVDDESTELKTDRFQNIVDGTVFYRFGQFSGGYVYETNDDDRLLTHYHGWRAGTVFRFGRLVTAKVNYAGRNKKDEEELTLLKDVESNRVRARFQVQPLDAFAVGGSYSRRDREFPDIRVETEGDVVTGFTRYSLAGWGAASGEYSHSEDTFDDRISRFKTRSDIVTGRIDLDRFGDLRLGGGVTYLDIGGDLDIEKSMFFVEGSYALQENYHVEVKYQVYNYDDYVLLDRYYTANVVWFNFGYDFDLK